MLLRIRVSNMASSGYVAHVPGSALAELAQKHNLFYVDNLGGGSLVDLTKQGLPECPTLQQGVLRGADLVLASGDKIIGGPQAGIIVGKKDFVSLISHHVLARTCQTSQVDFGRTRGNSGRLCRRPCLGRNPDVTSTNAPESELSQRATAIGKACRLPEWRRSSQRTPLSAAAQFCRVLRSRLGPSKSNTPYFTEDQLYDVLLARGVVARRAQGKLILDLRSVFSGAGFAFTARRCRLRGASDLIVRSKMSIGRIHPTVDL